MTEAATGRPIQYTTPQGYSSRVLATLTPNQVVLPGATGIMPLDAIVFDGLLEFDLATSYFSPKRPGYYLVGFGLTYVPSQVNRIYYSSVFLWGTVWTVSDWNTWSVLVPAFWPIAKASTIIYLEPGDRLGLSFQNGSAINCTVIGGGRTFMYAHRLS